MTDSTAAAEQPPAQPARDEAQRRVAALPFDQALAELQAVVSRLETGNLPLEDSIELYEQGVLLHEHCGRLLSQAELRVQRLVESAGGQLRALDLSIEGADKR